MNVQSDYWTSLSLRTGFTTAIDAGPDLRDGMTVRRGAAPGPVPERTSGLVAA
ncbi:hypothetical protein [Amycolatopsis tolypomycina]|uniref:Uncharacterized protein n=1 Tax=Amycolatopsis tolypomycina TaxID=208445 RepID=A0A1H5C1B2_9PSEU|nr:hypothetical protein [Amycolatopsis tolypomycina]SED60415.1 hypothetical protein SAMN04489727_8546 [Amycolatopsis tolypomycina]